MRRWSSVLLAVIVALALAPVGATAAGSQGHVPSPAVKATAGTPQGLQLQASPKTPSLGFSATATKLAQAKPKAQVKSKAKRTVTKKARKKAKRVRARKVRVRKRQRKPGR